MDFSYKRLKTSILIGAFLGVFCIIGVGLRLGFKGNEWYLFSMWYNRVVMGITIGFAGQWKIINGDKTKNSIIRGLILGTIVTSAIFFSTSFKDLPSWGDGIAYGIIIDYVSTKASNTK